MSNFDNDDFIKGAIVFDGFDDCVVGIVDRFGTLPILCYDRDKMIVSLQKQGMDVEEAIDFFECNIANAWLGDRTPCFLHPSEIKSVESEESD